MDFIWEFNYPRGHMSIVADEFFPCPKRDMNLLLKTLDLNPDFSMKSKLGSELKEYLESRIRGYADREELKGLMNDAVNNRTKAKEMTDDIEKQTVVVNRLLERLKNCRDKTETQKCRNLLKEEREKLKGLKQTQRFLLSFARSCEVSFESRIKDAAKIRDNLETLKTYLERWEW